jgi:hypothetical protein
MHVRFMIHYPLKSTHLISSAPVDTHNYCDNNYFNKLFHYILNMKWINEILM